ncbi:hypothetical protein AA313_de0206676 [Arthrobotrys entomopaga]|nr:hypothetical protein AA313_de0206676 [Arthrobotrys entomopaga]
MRSSILLYALTGVSSVLAVNFGGTELPLCASDCWNDALGQPGLSNCDNTDILCFCKDYNILFAMQDCLAKTNDCGTGADRNTAITDVQAVCDTFILNAAETSSGVKSTSSGKPKPAPTTQPEPTSLEEAEGRLGASASALINGRPNRLSTGAKIGIAIGSFLGFLILATLFFCCGCYHYKSHVIRKINRNMNDDSPAPIYPTENAGDKGTQNSWFTTSTGFKSHTRGATNDSHELGYGYEKELGLMISAPSNPRQYTTTKMQTVDILESEIPRAPPPAVFPHRNPMSPPLSSPSRTMSLGSVQAAQRPSLTLTPSTAVFPQATIEDYTPRNSVRVSVQSLNQKPAQAGPNINIPLMFFTPATPQVNHSPISPVSQNGDIYGYYSRESAAAAEAGIGIARTSLDRSSSSPQPYDPINNDNARAPSPYSTFASVASPYNNYNRSPEPRQNTPGFDMSTDASSRMSSPSPQPGVGLHMPPRYTPYNTSPPVPSDSFYDQTPRNPEMMDLSSTPATINRANSQAWRLSVERAADRAMDKVRSAATAIAPSGFEQVPEEEERLTKSELRNTTDESGRGRRKNRNQSQPSNVYGTSTNFTPPKSSEARSGSIGGSRSPSGRRTSAGGYGRRSSSLGGYRKRQNSLNQIDGIPRTPLRNSRRGSQSSSVMMI